MAPGDAAPAAEPQIPIVLVDMPLYDGGEVWAGDPLKHTFTLRNVGTADLSIVKVRPGCRCTAAGEHPEVIPPGRSGEFPFRVSVEKYYGRFSTSITIETNDPAHKDTKLAMSGFVKHYVTATPRAALFGNVKSDSVLARKLTLTNNTDTAMKPSISSEGPTSETFKGEIVEVEAGQEYELIITASPPYPAKYNQFMMEVDTGIPDTPTLKVHCRATLPKRLDVTPEMIHVASGRTISPRRIRFTNNGDKPVKLVSATALDQALKVTTSEKVESKAYEILVSLPEGYLPPPEGTSIVLKTDDAEQPELRIPVRRIQSASSPRTAQSPPAKKPPRRQYPAMQLQGKSAPQVALTTYDSKEMKIGGRSDKVQLLTFYASWCGFCRRALPGVEKIYQEYKDKGVEVVAISIDSRTGRRPVPEEKTLATYKQLNLSLPMSMDPEQKIGKQFNMVGTGVPAFFLVGKTGTIEAVHTGARVVVDETLTTELDLLRQGKTRADFPGANKPAPTQPAPGS